MITLLDAARWMEVTSIRQMADRLGFSYPVSLRALLQRILEQAPRIKHVFVLMLENRSFDHLLGFAGIKGTDVAGQPARALDLTMVPTFLDVAHLWEPPLRSARDIAAKLGLSYPVSVRNLIRGIHTNADWDGNVFVADDSAPFKISKADGDPNHEFDHVLYRQLCDGKYPLVNNSGFVKSANSSVMRCFAPQNVPVLVALAREFALCDRWFSSVPGPTWPNRFFLHAASSGGLVDSPDPSEIVEAITIDGYDFNNGTIFDRLDARGLSWKIFGGDNFPVMGALAGLDDDNFDDFDNFGPAVNDPDFDLAYTFIEPNYGDTLGGTYRGGNSQHPLDDIVTGEQLIRTVYEIIRNSPIWYNCALLITYDEGGGFFDHIPPPATVSPGDGLSDAVSEDDDNPNFDFTQLGVRVPAIIVSPHIRQGIVDHTVFDHTSLLATLERLFLLDPLTNRDRLANSFNHLFSLELPRRDTPTVLSRFRGFDSVAERDPILSVSATGDETGADIAPVSADARGFLDIAFRKNYQLASAKERPGLIEEYSKLTTRAGGREYMERVRLKSARAPLPIICASGKGATVLPLPPERVLGPGKGLTVAVGGQNSAPFFCYSTFRDVQGNGLELRFLVSPDPGIAQIAFPTLRLGQNPAQNYVVGLRPGQGTITVTAKSVAVGVPIPKFSAYSFAIFIT